MAFATTNIRTGVVGPLRFYCGDWTGNQNDASGAITLNGGRVYFRQFWNQDSESPKAEPVVDVSASGATLTVTVHNHEDVTTGRFIIVYA